LIQSITNAILSVLPSAENSYVDIFYAVICFIIGMILSVLLARLTKKLFIILGKNKSIDSRRFNTLATVMSAIVRFVILFLTLIQSLTILKLQSVVTSLTATIGIGTIIITISLQGLLRDVSAGLFMLFENEFSVGDYVTIGGLSGRVEKFNLRTTTIRADTGELHYFPNGTITAATNYSKGDFQISVNVPFSAAYDPFHTMKLLEAGIDKAFPGHHAAVRHIISINENSYTVRVQCDCHIGRKLETERELTACIIRVMAEEKIAFPNGLAPVVGE